MGKLSGRIEGYFKTGWTELVQYSGRNQGLIKVYDVSMRDTNGSGHA